MSELAVIVPYFNFMNYETPKNNFLEAMKHITKQGADLFIGEVALENQNFFLEPSPKVFQYKTNSVLWYKENIINVVVKNLPDNYKYVAWVDADCIFSNDNWIEDTIDVLKKFTVAQLFQKCVRLDRHKLPDRISCSVPFWLEEKKVSNEVVPYVPGGAWGAKREFIDKHNLFDAHVVGGSDSLVTFCYYGWWGMCEERINNGIPNEKVLEYFMEWAEPVYQDVLSSVGYINGHADFFWHGTLENRMYIDRQIALNSSGYNPYKDLCYDDNGILKWASDNTELHELVSDYFVFRKEDTI